MNTKIYYTLTDESPFLATQSLLPIFRSFAKVANIDVETKNISLGARILAAFAERLPAETSFFKMPVSDDLDFLGKLTQDSQANIIKLPNISASLPQLKAAIAELQKNGYAVPDYPDEPKNAEEQEIQSRYDKIKGSAVNPVLRQGNSDRRAPQAVKNYARKHPHSDGVWNESVRTHVSSMTADDFYGNETSVTLSEADSFKIEFVSESGEVKELRPAKPLLAGEILDSTVMRMKSLERFIAEQMDDAKKQGVLFSVHLKATMMKVSDPVMFGAFVRIFFKDVFDRYADLFKELGVNANNGLGDLYKRLSGNPREEEVKAAIDAALAQGPDLAMVDSTKGITNLHVPSDVIIDASMPAMIRNSGCMWNKNGELQQVKACIPDRCYAGIYDTAVEFCKKNGAFDPSTMGTVQNVGLMAQGAEEYGSSDKTFIATGAGEIHAVNGEGKILLAQKVEKGDIFRMCQTKDAPVRDWVKLAVNRARTAKMPAIFWLDPQRAHDMEIRKKVEKYLKEHDLEGLSISILSPTDAIFETMTRAKKGLDTISVTGNVMRDYLTDLFPILEVGTSAKMLSIVPLMAGGGMFETGAGGSAPKQVQQFLAENYLRWDSLGEYFAFAASLEQVGTPKAKVLADALDKANEKILENNRTPERKLGGLDNRGSHFYLALYWAQELAAQTADMAIAAHFAPVARALEAGETEIVDALAKVQGVPVDVGGYYVTDPDALKKWMRPVAQFNAIIDGI